MNTWPSTLITCAYNWYKYMLFIPQSPTSINLPTNSNYHGLVLGSNMQIFLVLGSVSMIENCITSSIVPVTVVIRTVVGGRTHSLFWLDKVPVWASPNTAWLHGSWDLSHCRCDFTATKAESEIELEKQNFRTMQIVITWIALACVSNESLNRQCLHLQLSTQPKIPPAISPWPRW